MYPKRKTLEALLRIHIELHDLSAGQVYMKEASAISDSINNERIRRNTIKFETKYESAKKDTQIKLHQAAIKQKDGLTMSKLLI